MIGRRQAGLASWRASGARYLGVAVAVAAVALALLAPGAWATPTFSAVPGELAYPRYAPTAAVLPNGKVLIAGGYNEESATHFLSIAELYNPATGGFETLLGEMTVRRDEQASVALPGGQVLVVGGYNFNGGKPHNLKSVELFNPETNTFETVAAEMAAERDGPGAALLANGKVLIVGGAFAGGKNNKTAELYDPATQTFTTVPGESVVGRYQPSVIALPNGKVLIAGGAGEGIGYLKTAELYNPETGTFELLSAGHEPVEKRDEAGAVLLPSGKALIIGGFNETTKDLKTLELFNPETNTFEKPTAELAERRDAPAATILPDGQVLVVRRL